MTTDRAILAVDEGTTGTRAALVDAGGRVHRQSYRALEVTSPRAGTVEQDADAVLSQTVDAIRTVVDGAGEAGLSIVGLAVATQRSTAVLWDARSGRALVPAMVWQDTRYAEDLAPLARDWDAELWASTGRPVGVRSPYLWAARHIAGTPAVREAHRAGRLRFGTMDTWLLWHLTRERIHAVTATNATAAGAYRPAGHEYHDAWLDVLGFPSDLLPQLYDDVAAFGSTRPELIGIDVPVLAAVGDLHAAIVGLGCTAAGSAAIVHGTGSFVDLVTGSALPAKPGAYDATLTLTAWRRHGQPVFSVETFTATTGSALERLCDRLGWFDSPREISRLAATTPSSGGVLFLPALTGLRAPVLDTRVRGGLHGLSTATTRAEVAHAVLEGIAHSVVTSLECDTAVAGREPQDVVVGGGLSASDPLLQMQADLAGRPMRRRAGSDAASLRGAAFLGGADGILWGSLAEATSTLDEGTVFEPRIGEAERTERRAAWNRRIEAELMSTEPMCTDDTRGHP